MIRRGRWIDSAGGLWQETRLAGVQLDGDIRLATHRISPGERLIQSRRATYPTKNWVYRDSRALDDSDDSGPLLADCTHSRKTMEWLQGLLYMYFTR